MPELADVEGFRRYFAHHAKSRRVAAIRAPDGDAVRNTTPSGLGRALHGRRFGDPRRRGKWLEAPVEGRRVLFHFGMTGSLHRSDPETELHPHDRVVFDLDEGRLAYRSQRRFGGVWLASTDDEVGAITGPLGPDAARLDRDGLARRLEDRRGALKPALMDQQLLAGIGNELADEILWQARLDPRLSVSELRSGDLDDLAGALRDVLRRSMRRGRIPEDPGWLKGVRHDPDPACPRCGRAIQRLRVGGRRTEWCPRCQPRRSGSGPVGGG